MQFKQEKTRGLPSRLQSHRLRRSLQEDIQTILTAAKEAQRRKRRFGFYGYLAAVYAIYQKWDQMGVLRSRSGELMRHHGMRRSADISPLRALLEATMPNAGRKQLSRWTRALQVASSKNVTPKQVTKLFRRNGGVAGCASLATEFKQKQNLLAKWS